MDAFKGSWKINKARTENFENFMKAAGFPLEMVKEYGDREWQVTYENISDTKIRSIVSINNRPNLPTKTYEFTLGEEIEIEGVDNDKTLSKLTWDGTKFTESHRSLPGAPMEFSISLTREIRGADMIIISTMKGVKLEEVYCRC